MDVSQQLRDLLLEGFNREDLRDLCFELGIDYDDLPAEGRSAKARELVAYMNRHGRTAELVALCRAKRPHLDWPEISEPPPEEAIDRPIDQPQQASEPTAEAHERDQDSAAGFRPTIWSGEFGEPDWVEIAAGPFWLGWDLGRDNEKPAHQYDLDSFSIARFPITNVQYRIFIQSAAYRTPDHWYDQQIPTGYENHPVRYVSFYDALAYCRWLSGVTGRDITLPSEAQWEKAARGGRDPFVYPWGNAADPLRANTAEANRNGTAPVDNYLNGASPFGVIDTCGNVWEWTRSAYKPYPYNAQDGRETIDESPRVLRGGAFLSSQNIARCSYRSWDNPDVRQRDDGFRVIAQLL